MTLMSPAALCKAVATANLRSFLFILIVQSVGCRAEQWVIKNGVPSRNLAQDANVCFLPPGETTLLNHRTLHNQVSLTFGPNVTPPPGRRGVLREPIRALPVPFWAYGFFPPPLTSDLVSVLAVPFKQQQRFLIVTPFQSHITARSRCNDAT